MVGGVSDEVWQALDPSAGRLSRRGTRRLWLAASLGLVLFAGGVLGWQIGLVVPRLQWLPNSMSGTLDTRDGGMSVRVSVSNLGRYPVTVVGAGRGGPGLDLVRGAGGLPVTLGPGEGTEIELAYRITDCAAMPRGDWPIPVVVDRPWGAMTVYPHGPLPDPVWWQSFADPYCHR